MTGACVANTATPHGPWRFASAPVSFVDGTANAQPDSGLHGCKEEFRKVTLEIFNEAGLLRHFGISEERAIRFFDHMYKLHGEIPYHCALHGLDVLGSAHCLMMQLRELNHGPFTELEVLALYTVDERCGWSLAHAALGHDAGHFGVNNAYLVNSQHPLYAEHPTSTLENFHAQTLVQVLEHPEDGLVGCLDTEPQRAEFLDRVRHLVLATDMAQHKRLFEEFVGWVDEFAAAARESEGGDERGGDGGGGRGGDENGAASSSSSSWRGWVLSDSQRMSALVMTVKSADLSNLVQDLPLADFWGYRILEENLAQGVREEKENIKQTTTPSREAAVNNYFNHQAGFLEFVVKPLFEKFTLLTTSAFREEVLAIAAANLRSWKYGHPT